MGGLNRKFTNWLYLYSIRRYRRVFKQPHFKHKTAKLTDHAIVRYLERVRGIDVEAARAEIWTPEALATIDKYGGTGKFVVNGILYTVDHGVIVTISRPNPNQAVVSGLDEKSNLARIWSF